MLQQNAVLTFTAFCSRIVAKQYIRRMDMENTIQKEMKFCKHCGQQIEKDVIVCTYCGKQVEVLEQAQPQVVINNSNMNTNTNTNINNNMNVSANKNAKNKWVSFLLCLCLGYIGAHKFYEGKVGMGILYLCTGGLFFVGVIIDLIAILSKPNPYYPK